MSTLFSRIIDGEIPSYKIYEDAYTFAFLDINPLVLWHTLVVPKIEVDSFIDVPEPYYSAVFRTAKKIAPAIQKATRCNRIATMIVGYEIPHFHYHVIPTQWMEDLDRVNTGPATPESLKDIQKAILSFLDK